MSDHAAADFRRRRRSRHPRIAELLKTNVRVPLYRDGNALVLNSFLTALLGAAYWLVAARDYRPHDVGVNTAAISAMMFLAGVAQLNLMSALVRFVPILRGARGRFIASCYLVATAAAVLISAAFVLGLDRWAPALSVLGSSPAMVVWFVAGTVAWSLFNLQDSALTGLGAAVLVPAENFVYGVAKIVLLLALISVSPHLGIFASWTGGLLVTILPVNLLIFGPLLRRRAAAAGRTAVPAPTRGEIVRFAAPDYFAALLWLAATTLMPVIVVAIAGATSNAYFSLAWMIITPIGAASASMGVALVATAAGEPQRLSEYALTVLRRTARLTIPAGVGLALLAPFVMSLFGRRYMEHGSLTLALLALSVIPNTVTALYTSIYRVQRRMRAVVKLQASLCGAILVLAPVLLSLIGIAGVGVAWLASQSVVAVVLLSVDPMSVAQTPRRPPVLLTRLASRVAARIRRTPRVNRRAGHALAQCMPPGMALNGIVAANDVIIGRARARDGSDSVFIKLARTPSGAAGLSRAGELLRSLEADPRLAGWEVRRPEIRFEERNGRHGFIIESVLPGVPMTQVIATSADWRPLALRAIDAIDELHRRTTVQLTADSEVLERWIHRPAQAIERFVAGAPKRAAAARELGLELAEQLQGRRLSASWVHGDFVPGNVLVTPGGDAVTAIIDWELASTEDIPALDRAMLMLAIHLQLERRELGQLVVEHMSGTASRSLRESLEQAAGGGAFEPLDARALTLLCWLRHAAAHVTYREPSARLRVWRHYNVDPVLDALGRR